MANIPSSTTTQTLTAQYNNVANGATISVSSGIAAITNAFTVGYDPTLVSNGIIIGTGTVNGVSIAPGDNSYATKIQNDGGARISGSDGVYVVGTVSGTAGVSGHYINPSSTPTSASIINAGIITGTGSTANRTTGDGIVFGTNVHGAVSNVIPGTGAVGTITGAQYGILFYGLGNFNDSVTNAGSIAGGSKAIVFDNIHFNAANQATGDVGTGNVVNTGIIGNAAETGVAIEFDTGTLGASVTNSGTVIGGIQALNGGVLNVQDATAFGSTITGVANFGSNSTLNLAGTGGIGTAANYIGFSTINIVSGADFALSKPGATATFSGNSIINNSGTILVGGALYDRNGGVVTAASINMEATLGIATTIDYTGSVTSTPIYDFGGADDIILSASALPTEGALSTNGFTYNTASGVLTVSETSAAGAVSTAFVTISEPNSYNSSSFVGLQNSNGLNVRLGSSTLLSTAGSIVIDYGKSVTLTDTAGVDTVPVTFGTHGSVTGINTLDVNGTVAGTNAPYQGAIMGFGLNDDIVIGPSTLPSLASGSAVTLSYAGSLLTVGEVNSAGSVTASTTINVGTGYSSSSFVALLGTNGINIETPATVDEAPLTFVGTAGTVNSFEDPTKYVGGLAPGSTIVPGETVIVAAGTASISSTPLVTDNGTIIVSGAGSTLIDSSTLAGTGTAIATNGGTISVATSGTTEPVNLAFGAAGTTLSPNVIDFTGTNVYGTPVGTVSNLGSFDNIVLATTELPDSGYYAPGGPGYKSAVGSGDFAAGQDSLSYNSVTGQIVIFDSATSFLDHNQNYLGQYPDYAVTINSTPGLNPANFKFTSVAGQGFVVSYIPCFAAGTRILTNDGQVAVETIKVGDKVLTFRDGAEAEVVWVGQRTVDLARHAMPEKVRPIRILAGAFGDGLPERDVRLSPDHALFIDGHLIEAKTLVNGVTVLREHAVRYVTYHHIELATHDVVLADGLPAESYLDSGNRVMFEDDAAPIMLHPNFAAISRAAACAPLAVDGDVVMAARSRLLARAVALGFVATGEIDLVILVDGVVLAPLTGTGTLMHFALPAGARKVEFLSSTGVPAEVTADPADRRVLGVAVSGLALIAGGTRREISLGDAAHEGFYEAEPTHRWTNGRAVVALPAVAGGTVLEVSINGQAVRWQARNAAA